MQLELGSHSFDVSTQALVVPTSNVDESFDEWVQQQADQGADAVYVFGAADKLVAGISRTASSTAIPMIATTADAQLAERCLQAGASAIDAGLLSDPAMLSVIADAGASVVIADSGWARQVSVEGLTPDRRRQGLSATVERALWAEAAGIARSRIIVKAPVDQVQELAAFGWVVEVATSDSDDSGQEKHVAAVMAGARVVRTNQVQSSRRTVSTVAELLQPRGGSAPNAVEFAGGS